MSLREDAGDLKLSSLHHVPSTADSGHIISPTPCPSVLQLSDMVHGTQNNAATVFTQVLLLLSLFHFIMKLLSGWLSSSWRLTARMAAETSWKLRTIITMGSCPGFALCYLSSLGHVTYSPSLSLSPHLQQEDGNSPQVLVVHLCTAFYAASV